VRPKRKNSAKLMTLQTPTYGQYKRRGVEMIYNPITLNQYACKEFREINSEQLKAKADDFLAAADQPLDFSNVQRPLEVQIYLAEVSHLDDARIARRDFRLGIAVIVPIALAPIMGF
jgi:hypothetical protein